MKNKHCRTWKMARIMKNVENEKHTLYDLEYGKTMKNVKNDRNTL
jgi:hypothetical protein